MWKEWAELGYRASYPNTLFLFSLISLSLSLSLSLSVILSLLSTSLPPASPFLPLPPFLLSLLSFHFSLIKQVLNKKKGDFLCALSVLHRKMLPLLLLSLSLIKWPLMEETEIGWVFSAWDCAQRAGHFFLQLVLIKSWVGVRGTLGLFQGLYQSH